MLAFRAAILPALDANLSLVSRDVRDRVRFCTSPVDHPTFAFDVATPTPPLCAWLAAQALLDSSQRLVCRDAHPTHRQVSREVERRAVDYALTASSPPRYSTSTLRSLAAEHRVQTEGGHEGAGRLLWLLPRVQELGVLALIALGQGGECVARLGGQDYVH